ncbi:MAG: hypothetical protein IPN44_14855 [Flavobacteriales bacterium]|nr:hypothetical protein [Flavobacteriales bacterium]
MNRKLFLACTTTFLLSSLKTSAQDVRAATYQWSQDTSIVLVDNILKLYVDSALDIHRSSVIANFDGLDILLNLYSTESLGIGITCHTFKKTQLYAGPGVYPHDIVIPFRVGQIKNFDSVDNITMELQPEFIIGSSFGLNSTPLCDNLQSNISQSAAGATYTPAFSDLDGDSLVFSLTNCSGPGYYIPSGCSINSFTGVIMANPPEPGLYAFCTRVEEYRFGAVISTTYTDMVMKIDNVTSVPQFTNNSGMSLGPNLIESLGYISVHIQGTADLRVFDASGKTVVQREVIDGHHMELRVVPGIYMYLLQERSGTGVLRGKLVVL